MKTLTKLMVIISIVLALSFSQECDEPQEVWFKISNEVGSENYGKLIQLDMSRGYANTDGVYIYLFVLEKDTDSQMVIAFPIGYWETEIIGKSEKIIPKKEKKEFDLDEYLKNNKGKGIEIKTKIGE